MKTYEKPVMEVFSHEAEPVLGFTSVNDKEGYNENGFDGGYAKRQDYIIEDADYLSDDIQFIKGFTVE